MDLPEHTMCAAVHVFACGVLGCNLTFVLKINMIPPLCVATWPTKTDLARGWPDELSRRFEDWRRKRVKGDPFWRVEKRMCAVKIHIILYLFAKTSVAWCGFREVI